jgi:hypothetical protein
VKIKGRQPAQAIPSNNTPGTGKPQQTKKDIITKHDLELAGRKNTNDLAKVFSAPLPPPNKQKIFLPVIFRPRNGSWQASLEAQWTERASRSQRAPSTL